LPKGWEWARLGNIAEINPRNKTEDDVPASFIPMPLISTAYDGRHDHELRNWGEIKKGYTHFAEGDIAVAKITPCFENSKAAIFRDLKNGIGAGTTELHVARPFGNTLAPNYILLYLKAPMFLVVGETKMTGTAGQKRLPKDFFESNPLPLPPLAEQHRIVAKVNELMSLCDALEQEQAANIAAHQTLVEELLAALTQNEGYSWARISTHFDTLFTTEHSIDTLSRKIISLAARGMLTSSEPLSADLKNQYFVERLF
jgi:Restriction endonuclease S subunits